MGFSNPKFSGNTHFISFFKQAKSSKWGPRLECWGDLIDLANVNSANVASLTPRMKGGFVISYEAVGPKSLSWQRNQLDVLITMSLQSTKTGYNQHCILRVCVCVFAYQQLEAFVHIKLTVLNPHNPTQSQGCCMLFPVPAHKILWQHLFDKNTAKQPGLVPLGKSNPLVLAGDLLPIKRLITH